ncbi:MAG: hypothetical protein ACLUEQ_03470 [Cloacibacillus evryensis]
MAQPDFAVEFLDICRAHNVHTAIESCLLASYDAAMRIGRGVTSYSSTSRLWILNCISG